MIMQTRLPLIEVLLYARHSFDFTHTISCNLQNNPNIGTNTVLILQLWNLRYGEFKELAQGYRIRNWQGQHICLLRLL